ncbi:MAG: hypothetical protein BEV12_19030 [Microcystis aeruginosa CACIAM 03]|nr:MAG: hypothetical protein BEV12_19030 [Microcystis aeruginosa CACIAM 03]
MTAKKSGKKDNSWGVPCDTKSCLKSLGEWGDHFVRVAGGDGEVGGREQGEGKTNNNSLLIPEY